MGAAAGEDSAGAKDVGAEKISVATPDADLRGGMKNRGVTGAGGGHGRGVVEGRGDEPNAAGYEGWIGAAGEHGDGAARGEEAFDEVAAEKTGAAGDESGGMVNHG